MTLRRITPPKSVAGLAVPEVRAPELESGEPQERPAKKRPRTSEELGAARKRLRRQRANQSVDEKPDFQARARAKEEVFGSVGGDNLKRAPGCPTYRVDGDDAAIIYDTIMLRWPELRPTGHTTTGQRTDPQIAALPAPARNLLYGIVALSVFLEIPIAIIAGMCDRKGLRTAGNGAAWLAGVLRHGRTPYCASSIRKALHVAAGLWLRWKRWTDKPFTDHKTQITYKRGCKRGGIYLPVEVFDALRFDPNVENLVTGLWRLYGSKGGAASRLRAMDMSAEKTRERANAKGLHDYTARIARSKLERESGKVGKTLHPHKREVIGGIPHHKDPVSSKQFLRASGAPQAAPGAVRPLDWNGSPSLEALGRQRKARAKSALAPSDGDRERLVPASRSPEGYQGEGTNRAKPKIGNGRGAKRKRRQNRARIKQERRSSKSEAPIVPPDKRTLRERPWLKRMQPP